MIRYALGRGLLALCLILLVASACAAKDVGQVISFKAGVTAQRGGQPVELGMKSPVGDKDTLTTDATGRAQILFDDDTTVALGSNTSLSLETVVAEGANPAFRARMGQGVARFITGKIVEKNLDGFSVVTPDATVGIRGTIFAVRVANGTTTVYVTNTTKRSMSTECWFLLASRLPCRRVQSLPSLLQILTLCLSALQPVILHQAARPQLHRLPL